MPTLLLETHAPSEEPMASVAVDPGDHTGAETNGSLVGLVDFARLMRDIGLGLLCGVGLGVFVAMIGDLC
jgi:hypothetical protein